MSIKVMCSVKDEKSGVFSNPVFVRTVGEAERGLAMQARTDEMMATWPEDFSLYSLGTFNEETGEVVVTEMVRVARVVDLIGDSSDIKAVS